MNTREELCDILMFELPDPNPWEGEIRLLIDRLVANGVTVQKHGRWILHDNGCGTCDRCRFTQKNVWDDDNSQNYCGVCGAKMDGGDAG